MFVLEFEEEALAGEGAQFVLEFGFAVQGVERLDLQTFLATAAGVKNAGSVRVAPSYIREFALLLMTTDALPRAGFVLPEGQVLDAIWDDSGPRRGEFAVDPNDATGRTYLSVRSRAQSYVRKVLTRPEGG